MRVGARTRVNRWRRTASKPDVFADPFATRQGNDGCGLDVCLAHPAGAQTPSAAFVPPYTGTLKKIEETEAVQIGYRDNSPPFASLDANTAIRSIFARSLSTKSPQKRASLALFAVVTQNQ